MPVYEYVCKDCGNKFDVLRLMKDADKSISCSHCHGLETKRALSVCFSHSNHSDSAPSSSGKCGNCSSGSCASCAH